MSNHKVIVKANDLVEARYKLTLTQQRLVLYLIAQIKPGDIDFQTYELRAVDFCRYLQIDPCNTYAEFVRVSESLITKSLLIRRGEETIITAWLSSARYHEGTGIITLCFAPELKEFLLELKGHFTKYSLKHVKQFKSTYSIRIYELLKQYQKFGERTFELDDLKEMLQVKNLYKDYNLFKRRALIMAVSEINTKSDILIDFLEIKKSRKVVKIQFHISQQPITPQISHKRIEQQEQTLALDKSSIGFITEPLTDGDRKSILRAADGDAALVKAVYELAQNQGCDIGSLTAWMIAVIKKKLRGEVNEPIKTKGRPKKNKFSNFSEREIDFDKLERLELEQLRDGYIITPDEL